MSQGYAKLIAKLFNLPKQQVEAVSEVLQPADQDLINDLVNQVECGIFSERARKILQLYFGLNDGQEKTLEVIGNVVEPSVNSERVRQIVATFCRKLRYPSRIVALSPIAQRLSESGFDSGTIANVLRRSARQEANNNAYDFDDDTPLSDFEFSWKVHHGLKNEGIGTVGELQRKSEIELLKIPNWGPKAVNEIKAFLARYGRSLKSEP